MMVIRNLLIFAASLAPLAAQNQRPVERLAVGEPRPRTVAELAAQTVVVFNQNDTDSLALAGLYAEKRGIATANLVPLRCARSEEITRAQYDEEIAGPLREIFVERGWWKLLDETTDAGRVEETKIRFVVLMRGIPLRIAATVNYGGDVTDGVPAEIFQRNDAAVESELAVLGLWSRRISGVLLNPYHRGDTIISDTDLSSQLIVTRLDAPTPAIVRRMIADTVAAEAKGLRGFMYVDARGVSGGPLQEGDRWLHEAARDARENGMPVILDDGPALFPPPYPMRNAAVYLGWYSEEALGPFLRDDFKFVPGAVAVHLHSFSARTLRADRNWCVPLLKAGAAATLGNVAEPYLGLTAELNVFSQRLREGFTFGEACQMSVRYLSWMNAFIGDPLYRPFLNVKEGDANEWDAYRAGVRTWVTKGRAAGETALEDAAKRMKKGVISEGLGLLELSGNDNAKALAAFQQARADYEDDADRARVAVHEAGAIAAMKNEEAAAAFLRERAAASTGSGDFLSILAQLYSPRKSAPPAPNRIIPKAPGKQAR
jgi:uncharacterized protein (TIGR03790 family)